MGSVQGHVRRGRRHVGSAVKKLVKLKATLEHIIVEVRVRHWTSKIHEYQGKLAAPAAAEACGAPNEAELVI